MAASSFRQILWLEIGFLRLMAVDAAAANVGMGPKKNTKIDLCT